MRVLIDADACPVVDIAVRLCKNHGISCLLLCDTAHAMHRDGAETLIFDKGSDSVDFALVNQDGWEYTLDNISGLMEQRHVSKKHRMAGGRTKGPAKRTKAQDIAFEKSENRHHYVSKFASQCCLLKSRA